MSSVEKVAPYAKAIIGALIAFLTALITALDNGGSISSEEWITAVVALLVAGGAIFSVPNKPPFVPEPEPTQLPAEPIKATKAKLK